MQALTQAQIDCVLATQHGMIRPFLLRLTDIHPDDQALALSRKPRYNGHTARGVPALSVLQHELDGEYYLQQEGESPLVRLAWMVHDHGEAVTGDPEAPFAAFFPDLLAAKEYAQRFCYIHYLGQDLDVETFAKVHKMDLAMCALEARRLFPNWRSWPNIQGIVPPTGWNSWRGPIPAEQAEAEYLERFAQVEKEWEAERG